MSNLQSENQPRTNLFAGLKMTGSSPSGGLFGIRPTAPSTSGLFAPSKLANAASTVPSSFSFSGILPSSAQSQSQSFNEDSIVDSLMLALKDTENDESLLLLVGTLFSR